MSLRHFHLPFQETKRQLRFFVVHAALSPLSLSLFFLPYCLGLSEMKQGDPSWVLNKQHDKNMTFTAALCPYNQL
jgi:hypothetical protein